jgi:hypothetical protein
MNILSTGFICVIICLMKLLNVAVVRNFEVMLGQAVNNCV